MSKQVVVTDSFGNKTTYTGVVEIYVEGGALWLAGSDEKTIAVIRSWERAEPAAEFGPSNADVKPAREITVDLEAPVHYFSKGGFVSKPDCTRSCCPSCCDKEAK